MSAASPITPATPKDTQRLVRWMFLHTFSVGIFIAFFFSTANSIFVNEYGRDQLPYGYLFGGLVGLLVLNTYAWLQTRISFNLLHRGVYLFLAGLMLLIGGLSHLLPQANHPTLAYALFITIPMLTTLTGLEISGLAIRLLNLRQSKQYFARINAGLTFASILGFLSIPIIISRVGDLQYNFLFLAALGALIAYGVLGALLKRFALLPLPAPNQDKPSASSQRIFRNPYVVLIALTIGISIMSIYFLDYAFMDSTQKYARELANNKEEQQAITSSMLSLFYAISRGCVLLVSFLSGAILSRLGIRFGLLITPIVLVGVLVITAVLYLLGEMQAEPWDLIGVFYFSFAFQKMSNRAGRKGLEIPSTRVLYMVLPPQMRSAVQTKVDGNIDQLATATAGALLLLLEWIMGQSSLNTGIYAILLVPVFSLWAWLAYTVYRRYRSQLHDCLERPDPNAYLPLSGVEILVKHAQEINEESPLHQHLVHTMSLKPLINNAKLETAIKIVNHYKERGRQATLENEPLPFISLLRSNAPLVKAARPALIVAAMYRKDTRLRAYLIDMMESNQTSQLVSHAVHTYKDEAITDLAYSFDRTNQSRQKNKIIRVYEQINTPQTRKLLFGLIGYHQPYVQLAALDALSRLQYTAPEEDHDQFIRPLIRDQVRLASWTLAALYDLEAMPEGDALRLWLTYQLSKIQVTILRLLGLMYGGEQMRIIQRNLMNPDSLEMRVFALENLDNELNKEDKSLLMPVFEDAPIARKRKHLQNSFPQPRLSVQDRLRDIVTRTYITTGQLPTLEALRLLHPTPDSPPDPAVYIALFNHVPFIYQTAAQILRDHSKPEHYREWIGKLSVPQQEELENRFHPKNTNNVSIYTRLSLVQAIPFFAAADNPVQMEYALNMRLISLTPGEEVLLNDHRIRKVIFWVIKGELQIEMSPYSLDTLTPTDMGWPSLWAHQRVERLRITESTQLMALSQYTFFNTLLDYPELTQRFLDQYSIPKLNFISKPSEPTVPQQEEAVFA